MTELDRLLSVFCGTGSSDLHLTGGGVPYIRLHGSLYPLEGFEAVPDEDMERLTEQLTGRESYQRYQKENELDMAVTWNGYRMRVNIYRQQKRTAWALRLLPSKFFELEELGISLQVLEAACSKQKGLVLVTGATGSGKSTTLASIIHRINQTRNCHIFTIEDPVEYKHENIRSFISQREVGEDTASFDEALRRVLREDPDVVLIGEMRDQTTMRAALTLAETGHLTFGTLHTSGALQTVTRLIGAFPANEQEQIRTQLASTLDLVISQQLIPWSNGNGRSLAAEIMVGTPAVKALIRESRVHQLSSAIQTGQQYGMKSMNSALSELVKGGMITPERALEWSPDTEELKRQLTGGY